MTSGEQPSTQATRRGAEAERRHRLLTRVLPLVAVALIAFIVGLAAGDQPTAPAVVKFLTAWESSDYESMHAELTPDAQSEFPLDEFRATYENAAETATLASISTGEIEEEGDAASSQISLETKIFGTLSGQLSLPITEGKVAWTPELVYPGLADGERLTRRTRAPGRAAILAVDGSPLASGPAAARDVTASSLAVVGEVAAPREEQAKALAREGFPPGSLTGTSGLELAYNARLSGMPGGQLLATTAAEENELEGGRELATTEPKRGKPVRTTIDPAIQESAVAALGDLYGGVAAIDAKNGSVLALAGLGYSAPQPPGSTFKVITATAALDEGLVKTTDEFPVETSNSDIGREIANSHDSPCGGNFVTTFADSCNTVFAPLGVEVGAEKLVAAAEAFGFNAPPPLFNEEATEALKPPSSTLPTDLDTTVKVGETAIGQGEVLATPLEMAAVAQTIANGGVRMPNPIAKADDLGPEMEPVEVTSPETAATMRDLMIEVVKSGTGVAGGLSSVQVAGKTGTAELGPAALDPGQELGVGEEAPQELDAWFTAFAPALKPKVAVAVMIVDSTGDGGEVAAPIAAQVLGAALDAD